MPEPFRCKELGTAWRMESDTHAGGQAWPPFREKLKALVRFDLARVVRLVSMLADEVEQDRLQAELPHREAMLTGRADRPARQLSSETSETRGPS